MRFWTYITITKKIKTNQTKKPEGCIPYKEIK